MAPASVSSTAVFTCVWIVALVAGDECDLTVDHHCGDGRCVPRNYLCDGDNDCEDKSDELHCFHINFNLGDNVTLPCRAPSKRVGAVEWIRADLQPEHVFQYQDGQSAPAGLHPSYVNRLELKDHEMKDGDVSVILKHVTLSDAGRFECHVVHNETKLRRASVVLEGGSVQMNVTAGDAVTLPCRAPSDRPVRAEWRQWGMPVLVYHHGHSLRHHPLFLHRVELKDHEMKDGDVSVILKHVTLSDAGRFECYVVHNETQLRMSVINLDVAQVSSTVPVNITSEPGETVLLPCGAHGSNMLMNVKLIRRDLDPENVFLWSRPFPFISNGYDAEVQHASFEGRVELDTEDVDGEIFLILKSVTANNTGTYECYVQNVFTDVGLSRIFHLDVGPSAQVNVTAHSGENVSLPCQLPRTQPVSSVEWTRPDLEPKGVLDQGGRSGPDQQHPWFRNRVELEDQKMDDGDASLVLKDARPEDSGTYECRVVHRNISHRRSTVRLDVDPADPEASAMRIVLQLLVFCPFLVSTGLMVSLCGHRASGRKQPVSTSVPDPDEESGAVAEHRF